MEMNEINIEIQIELNIHNSSHLAPLGGWLSFRFRHSSTPNLPRLLIILVHNTDEEEEIETGNALPAYAGCCDCQGLISARKWMAEGPIKDTIRNSRQLSKIKIWKT